jgi:hypothetical protein
MEFWRVVGHLHQLGSVPLSQLAEQLEIDRKFMREKAREHGWTKIFIGTIGDLTIAELEAEIAAHPANGKFRKELEVTRSLHDQLVEQALCLKTMSQADIYAAAKAAGISPVNWLDARVEARRHG